MTSSGSAYARFSRSLENGSLTNALAAARELGRLGVTDALRLTLLVADKEPARFERTALRWFSLYCHEHPDVRLDEARAVLAALAMLRTERAPAAARALAELLDRRGLEQASRTLLAWAEGR